MFNTINKVNLRKLFTISIISILIILTTILIIKNNLFKPTIPTIQIYSLTIDSDILTTRDSFINFIINFRLVETILFITITTLIFLDYLDRRKYIIFILVKTMFIVILFFNQLIVKNPYPTIPFFRRYLGINTIILDCMGFLLLVVFLIIDLTILILTIISVVKTIRVNSVVKNTLFVLTIVFTLTVFLQDYIIAYILLYTTFYTVFVATVVNNID